MKTCYPPQLLQTPTPIKKIRNALFLVFIPSPRLYGEGNEIWRIFGTPSDGIFETPIPKTAFSRPPYQKMAFSRPPYQKMAFLIPHTKDGIFETPYQKMVFFRHPTKKMYFGDSHTTFFSVSTPLYKTDQNFAIYI